MEQVNAFNDFRKQANGPFSKTYNPGWRNHPNFSWKQNQGGAPHQAHNQYPPGFHQPVHHQGRPVQPAPAYQAPNQAPASSSQSTLEDTLKAFMQLTGQSINDVKNATMVNTQAISKMETQIGQIASHLGEREKGKLPSQPVPNPKLQFHGGSLSNVVHGQEHVQAIVTLRLGKQVDNQVVLGSGLTGYVNFKFISLPLAIVRIDCIIVRVIEPQRLLVVLRNRISKECI
jgi:hypothetical protein